MDAERGKFRTRQVATPDAEVLGNVAENVGELQPFTKTDGSGFHEDRVPMSQRRHMSHRDTGPKLADTSRDKVGVLIEVIPPF